MDEANVIYKTYSSNDQSLDSHVFGNIGLKQVDFKSPDILKLMKVKKVETKKDAYLYALDKLRIMFDVAYTRDAFQRIKMYNLNVD